MGMERILKSQSAQEVDPAEENVPDVLSSNSTWEREQSIFRSSMDGHVADQLWRLFDQFL